MPDKSNFPSGDEAAEFAPNNAEFKTPSCRTYFTTRDVVRIQLRQFNCSIDGIFQKAELIDQA